MLAQRLSMRLIGQRAANGVATAASRAGARGFSVARPPVTSLSEEEQMLRDSVARFAKEVVAPKVREMDEKAAVDPAIIRGMFEQGLMGVETEEEYGGSGSSFLSAIIAIEELAKVDPSVSVICDVQNTLVTTGIRKWGSTAQKKEWLPRLFNDTVGSFCLSEMGSGSDAFAMQTRAVDAGSHWVINGSKAWITNAEQAGLLLVFANADPTKGYKGISCFMVPRDTPGVEVSKKEDKLGIRASSTCPIIFTDVKVPKENLMGTYGQGYKYAIEILNEGRIGIGAQMLGLAEGVFEATMPYLHQRKQFGTFISDFQGMQFQYAEIAIEIEAARLLVYNAARMKEAGLPFVKEAAMAKYFAARVAEKSSSKCIEWLGGVGFTKDFGVEKFWRDSKIGAIYEGTNNVHLLTIAKLISATYRSK